MMDPTMDQGGHGLSATAPHTRAGVRPLRAAFVMEQHLGHRTFHENLRAEVERADDVDAHWVEVPYAPADAAWERLDRLPASLRGALRGRTEVRRGLDGLDVDVAFHNTQVPAVLGGRRSRATRTVLCTDITPVQYDRMAAAYDHVPDRGAVRLAKHLATRRVLRGADRLVGWSSWVAGSLRDDYGVDPGRVAVVPPGVDVQLWRPRPTRARGPLRLVFVGGDLGRKGGHDLLAAFHRLPAGSAELTLVTRDAVRPGPGVRVEGHHRPNGRELRALVRRSDVFVLPTHGEAFGIAAVEAAASGLPVVATPVGGLGDVVEHERTGLVVPVGDVEALTRALVRLARDPEGRAAMGAAARVRALARFDARRNAGRVLDVVRDAAAGGPAPHDRRRT